MVQINNMHALFDDVDKAQRVGRLLPVRGFAEAAVELDVGLREEPLSDYCTGTCRGRRRRMAMPCRMDARTSSMV